MKFYPRVNYWINISNRWTNKWINKVGFLGLLNPVLYYFTTPLVLSSVFYTVVLSEQDLSLATIPLSFGDLVIYPGLHQTFGNSAGLHRCMFVKQLLENIVVKGHNLIHIHTVSMRVYKLGWFNIARKLLGIYGLKIPKCNVSYLEWGFAALSTMWMALWSEIKLPTSHECTMSLEARDTTRSRVWPMWVAPCTMPNENKTVKKWL